MSTYDDYDYFDDEPEHEDIVCPDCGVTLGWVPEERAYICVCGYTDDASEWADGSEGISDRERL